MKKLLPLAIIFIGIGCIVFVFWYSHSNPSVVLQRKTEQQNKEQTKLIQAATENLQKYNDCMLAVLREKNSYTQAHPQMTQGEAKQLEATLKAEEADCNQKYPQSSP